MGWSPQSGQGGAPYKSAPQKQRPAGPPRPPAAAAPSDPWGQFEPQGPSVSNPYAKPANTAQLSASGSGESGPATMGAGGKSASAAPVAAMPQGNAEVGVTQNQGYNGAVSGRRPYGASDSPPMSSAPNNNDFNRKLTEGEYQNRWGDLMSRGPVMAANGQRSDLPSWAEFLSQSGQFNGGTNLDPMNPSSNYRSGPIGAMPHATWSGIPRLPGKEMQKWKGGKYTGDGTWENEGAGPTRSGGGPSGT